ncbi:hypothetical protein G3576_00250 [Roseomonas stagni]|uniref:Uncharacterized protein n=1 Tax=Falsiroseomonas algicola TaxID=2716930 RepID=A0A6M1LDU6_9PROT|nr:hypothetical protein [Falsiroseomonas algicola]NGM18426.1 hypothetical protein [Falsiroseomonas algicola]
MPCPAFPRLMLVAPILALAACGTSLPPVTPITAPAPVPRGERDARYEACRDQATRVVQYRERGQLMRSDETESGRGTMGVAPMMRVENDRGAAQIDRDRLIAECLRASPDPVRGPAAATPATTDSTATTTTGTRRPATSRALPPPGVGTR